MYDPNIGRWLSEDPIGFDGGTTNLAEYVGNGPTYATDPSGLEKEPIGNTQLNYFDKELKKQYPPPYTSSERFLDLENTRKEVTTVVTEQLGFFGEIRLWLEEKDKEFDHKVTSPPMDPSGAGSATIVFYHVTVVTHKKIDVFVKWKVHETSQVYAIRRERCNGQWLEWWQEYGPSESRTYEKFQYLGSNDTIEGRKSEVRTMYVPIMVGPSG